MINKAFSILVMREDYIREGDKHNYNHASTIIGPEEFIHMHCLSGGESRDIEDGWVARRIQKHDQPTRHCCECGGAIGKLPARNLVLTDDAKRRARYQKERSREVVQGV